MRRFGSALSFIVMLLLVVQTPLIAEKKKRSRSRAVKKSVKGDYVIEKRSDGTTVKYKKKTTYEFEGADIEGLFKKPSGAYISNIKGVKGRTIIRIRKNFDSEVIDSARLLR